MNPCQNIKKLAFSLLIIHFMSVQLSAQEDAVTILKAADKIFQVPKSYSVSTMSITRNGRKQADQKFKSYSFVSADGTSRSLAIFIQPARLKGTANLTIGDGIWVRFASTGRTRKLSSSAKKNSANGSDFSYADLGDGSKGYSDLYDAKYDGSEEISGTNAHRLILTPKPSEDATYEKLVVWIAKDSQEYLKIQFWDKGSAIKEMFLENFKTVDGNIRYPFKTTMKSLAKNSVTTITTETIEINSDKVEEGFFNTKYLEYLK